MSGAAIVAAAAFPANQALRVATVALGLTVALAWTNRARAHEEIRIQIEAVTERIEESPDDAMLHLRRGSLYRIHEEWDAALADYDRALALEPALASALVGKASVLLATARPEEGLSVALQATQLAPDDPQTHLAAARLFGALGRIEEADASYARALAVVARPGAELYLERADHLRRQGKAYQGRAIVVLQDGITRVGPVVTLADPLIALQIAAGLLDEAMATCDRIVAATGENPKWLLERANLFLLGARFEEAEVTCRRALDRLAALPARRRRTVAIRQIEDEVRATLERVAEARCAAGKEVVESTAVPSK